MSLTAERLKVNKSTASRILEDFVALGILIEKTGLKEIVNLSSKITLNYLDNPA